MGPNRYPGYTGLYMITVTIVMGRNIYKPIPTGEHPFGCLASNPQVVYGTYMSDPAGVPPGVSPGVSRRYKR